MSGENPLDNNHDDEDNLISPFEWLTNFSSLSHLLDPNYLFPGNKKNDNDTDSDDNDSYIVFHVGCGSSIIAESLLYRYYPQYSLVVNVDSDLETLQEMEKRWSQKSRSNKERNIDVNSIQWLHFNFKDMSLKKDDHHIIMNENNKLKAAAASNSTTSINKSGTNHEHKTNNQNHKKNVKQLLTRGGQFDLVLDKSTLDCALCSDDTTSGLLCNIHHALNPNGGIYFVISFHHVDFVLPLLRDCPGVDWDVEHHVVKRQLDDILLQTKNGGGDDNHNRSHEQTDGRERNDQNHDSDTVEESAVNDGPSSSVWASGTFLPNENYGKTVNIFICRRRRQQITTSTSQELDRNAVQSHIHETNDNWFKTHNPMMTHVRQEDLRRLFLERLVSSPSTTPCNESSKQYQDDFLKKKLPLNSCYDILFTEAEREDLTFEYFIEDWNAFVNEKKEKDGSPKEEDGEEEYDGMTYEVALDFLIAMQ